MSIGECLSKCCISRVQPNLCKVCAWRVRDPMHPVQGERSGQYSDWGITLITGGKRAKRVPPPELTIHTYRPCLSEVVLCVAIALLSGYSRVKSLLLQSNYRCLRRDPTDIQDYPQRPEPTKRKRKGLSNYKRNHIIAQV